MPFQGVRIRKLLVPLLLNSVQASRDKGSQLYKTFCKFSILSVRGTWELILKENA